MTNKQQEPFNFKKAALVSALLLELAGTASAATINVDGVTCNLNNAVTAANTDTATGGCDAGVGDDVLELPIDGMLNLTVTASITSNVTINGNNSTIQPDPGIAAFRIIDVTVDGTLTINDATLQNGNEGATGGISAAGVLNMNRCVVSNITGGGVSFINGATGSVNDTLIETSGNSAFQYYAAGLSVASGTVTISNSTISNNNNISAGSGGAIWVNNYYGAVDVTILNSTISGNMSANRGGGISHSDYGNGSTITLTNVTIAANTSNAAGGGISNDASAVTISQSLISGNTGTGGAEIDSAGGTVTVDDYNLFGLADAAGVVGVTVGASDIVPMETLLTDIVDTTLADNGGPTPTHALPMGSPAIDSVVTANCASGTDQTGKIRPQDGDGDMAADCDIGAFEVEGPDLDLIFENGFESP